jgi:hypothetical protein
MSLSWPDLTWPDLTLFVSIWQDGRFHGFGPVFGLLLPPTGSSLRWGKRNVPGLRAEGRTRCRPFPSKPFSWMMWRVLPYLDPPLTKDKAFEVWRGFAGAKSRCIVLCTWGNAAVGVVASDSFPKRIGRSTY